MDRSGLADFLRRCRESLQPEDVGLPRGQRRRTAGLRREEVAALAHMSVDYYARIERQRGPQPSASMVAAVAQALHLSLDQRDHLYRLAGHHPPVRGGGVGEHLSPGMLRILDRLDDTPAKVVTELGETLRQTRPGVALLGDASLRTGPARSLGFRWFTDPATRAPYHPDDHDLLGRAWTSGLRHVLALRGPRSRAAHLAEDLLARSAEFRRLWELHEVGVHPGERKRLVHPELGLLELQCQTLQDPLQGHSLLVYTAAPGTATHDKLQLLAAVTN
ncbi:helix-turn-helix transcriptional regulator [Klenkia sp. LSe6-5]|uniref:Helix-turn-helix transcriptional regulator n=1 Tax=Klenkia sesuvii TaxID=3103137 RepID=A0ABU8DY16_9ACTN